MPALVDRRIVIVEDEGVLHMHTQRVLTRGGLIVVGTAITGEEAVEVVLREHPDIVLMDISLPGMDGIEAARRILAEYSVPCLIFLSGYSDEQTRQKVAGLKAHGHIFKPVIGDSLLAEIARCWQDSQSAAPDA